MAEVSLRKISDDDFYDDEGTPTRTTDDQVNVQNSWRACRILPTSQMSTGNSLLPTINQCNDNNVMLELKLAITMASHSIPETLRVEETVLYRLGDFEEFCDLEPGIHLNRDDHIPYLLKGLKRLSTGYQCLDASQPWLCYWIVHSLSVLGHELSDEEKSSIVEFLLKCQNPDGGYGGGPDQMSHLAPTYAAVNCLCTIATEAAFKSINREKLLYFLYRMRQPNGSFTMHDGGECDTRSLYCAASVASLTGILENVQDSLFAGSEQYVVSCQTYEGGIGGCPGAEAHGGYTFCGYAALVILGHEKLIDTDRLLHWLTNRQMRLEGGFQSSHAWLFEQKALQEYLLISCQSRFGGLIDKPGKSSDYYHTCYCLSGLSIAQHSPDSSFAILGHHSNLLVETHPVYNIVVESVIKTRTYFQKKPLNLDKERD